MIFYVVGALVLLSVVLSYKRFARQRALIRGSFANIDTELKRRYDLIPNLLETVKGYAAHERAIVEEVTCTRAEAMATTGRPAEQAAAEGPLVSALRGLFAIAENYPQLRASENFVSLKVELANMEDRIQASRRFYNANVRDYNARTQIFPSKLVASAFHFEEEDSFQVEPALSEQTAKPPQADLDAPPVGER